MEITCFKGPNRNDYCKIITNGREEIYDIDGISRNDRITQDERKNLLIDIVGRNLNIRHSHVIFLAQEIGRVAKKTIEKELENLSQDGILESEKEGEVYSNGPRMWSIKSPEMEFEKQCKKEAKIIVKVLGIYISAVEKSYSSLNQIKKAWVMTHLFQVLHSYQPIIEIINQETKIKNEKQKFDSYVSRAYKILKNENRDGIDGRPVLRRLLFLKSSKPRADLRLFLEEIEIG